jgi:phosphate transport system substrate-binding protein
MASPETRCPECQQRLIPVKRERPGPARWIALGAAGLTVVAVVAIAVLQIGRGDGQRIADGQTEPVVPLRLQGSNTIGSELGPRLAQAYLEQIGDIDVRIIREPGNEDHATVVGKRNGREEAITVAAHGSATAFSGLRDGSTDVGMASRRVKSEERDALMSKCDMTSSSCEHVLALDGVAVIVNHSNRIDSMTIEQLRSVFTGAVLDWSQLGLPAGSIHIYARDNKSGTFDTFASLVLDGQKLRPDAQRFEDSAKLASSVDGDANGIGFIGLPYIGPTKAVSVAAAGAQPLRPNRLTVATEDYVLARRLYLYGPEPSAPPTARRFVEFALSAQGQKIVEDAGFVSLTIRAEPAKVPSGAPAEYRNLVDGSQRLQFDFRFAFSSSDLDNRALRDTKRLADFLPASNLTSDRLLLMGFADSTGNHPLNKALSERRANAVGKFLEQDGIKAGKIAGLGDLLPVADNTTEEGREKNRRVEVYIRP